MAEVTLAGLASVMRTHEDYLRVRLTVEYLGARHAGFQRQARVSTIQSELETAVEMLLKQRAKRKGIEVSEFPAIVGSGRTDSGVHARGQVVSFLWPRSLACELDSPEQVEGFRRALDGITAREISIRTAEVAPFSFDARQNVECKQYSYHLLYRDSSPGLRRGRAWWLRPPLDIESMIAAARVFRGTHDFTGFRAGDCQAKNPVRTIALSEFVRLSDDHLVYIVRGQGFLKQMVRIIAGTLVEVGHGSIRAADMPRILAEKNRDLAGKTAPAYGLVLDWVRYKVPGGPPA